MRVGVRVGPMRRYAQDFLGAVVPDLMLADENAPRVIALRLRAPRGTDAEAIDAALAHMRNHLRRRNRDQLQIFIGINAASREPVAQFIVMRRVRVDVGEDVRWGANGSVGIQHANPAGGASGAEQTHTLAGHDHRSEIVQEASGTLADVTLSQGGGSTGQVRQTQSGAKASIAIKNGPSSRARLVQTGSGRGNVADVDVDDNNQLGADLQQHEFQLIIDALKATGGSRKTAAENLGISPRTLRYKLARMREAGLDLDRLLGK